MSTDNDSQELTEQQTDLTEQQTDLTEQQTDLTSNEECIELKNIKYKTMLINGTVIQEIKSSNNLSNLEKFLEDNKTKNQSEPWSKLDKTIKTKKLIAFAENYSKEKNYDSEDANLLVAFLKDSLDRKRLQRIKDVDYDKITGEIKDIPALHFNKATKHFTLKNMDKRLSTLKSLPPKKVRGTAKNIKDTSKSDTSSDSEKD
jgi:hypothetical protein